MNSRLPETTISAPVCVPTEAQNSCALASSVRTCVGSLTSGGVWMISKRVRFSSCFFRKRWNSRLEVDVREALVARLLGVGDDDHGRERDPLVAAKRQLGLQREPEADLVDAGRKPAAAPSRSRSAAAAAAKRRQVQGVRTGGLSGRLRVGRVELGEARVVAADVLVVRLELERLLVLGRARARNRRWPPWRRRGCCGRGRCPGPSRSPARIGRPPPASGPSFATSVPKASWVDARSVFGYEVHAPVTRSRVRIHVPPFLKAATRLPCRGGYYRFGVDARIGELSPRCSMKDY